MESKHSFFNTIFAYYNEKAGELISTHLLKELSERITDYYYEQYSRFRVQYPKSVKRYSTFRLHDLDHPQVYDIVIKFFKEKTETDYPVYVNGVLGMSLEELNEYEKGRQEYYNK